MSRSEDHVGMSSDANAGDEGARVDRRELLRLSAVTGGLLALGPALAACGSSAGDSAAETTARLTRGGSLRVAAAGVTTESKNVFNTQSPQEIMRNRQLFDWLGYMEGEKPVPYLLESMEPDADFTQWQLKLRDGATFHDGSPVTAEDVMFSLRSAGNPEIGGGLLSASAASIDMRASRATGARSLTLKLDTPLADLDTQIYAGRVYVIKSDPRLKAPASFTIDKAVGSGPYTLQSISVGQSAKLAIHRDYWGTGIVGDGPYLDELEIFNLPEPTARLNALLGGQADLGVWLDYAGVRANAKNATVAFDETSTAYAEEGCFIMNSRVKPFDDPRVRMAFKLACDRRALVAGALMGYGSIANDLQGVGFPDYYADELPQREFDPEQAKALLGQAGVLGEEIEISIFPGVATGAAAQIYARQLDDVGMKATTKVISPPDMFRNFPTFDNLQLLAVAVPGNQPLATSIAPRSLVSRSTFNVAGWLEPDWDRRLFMARGTPKGERRKELMLELQQQFMDESGWIVWGYEPVINGTLPGVHDVRPDGVGDAPNVRNAWKSKA